MTITNREQQAVSGTNVSHENEISAAAAVAREQSELAGAMQHARECPRSEASSFRALITSCERLRFADEATYTYPRGGKQICGPSVKLAREVARCWGNMRCGLRYVFEDEERVLIKGYAHDLENNSYVEFEDSFRKMIQRKVGNGKNAKTEWVKPDERDERELVNRRGAICVRNSILAIFPSDIIEDALEQCRKTLRDPKNQPVDRRAAMRAVVKAFDQVSVTPDMLEHYLGHDLEALSDDEMAELRGIFGSIRDGHTRREEHFTVPRRSDGGAPDEQKEPESPGTPPDAASPEEQSYGALRDGIRRFALLKQEADGPLGFTAEDEEAWFGRLRRRLLAPGGAVLDDLLKEVDQKIAELTDPEKEEQASVGAES